MSLARSQPDGLPRPLRPILQERTHLRPLPFRAGQDALGVARNDPRVAAVLASFLDRFGVVGGIAQHDHLRLFRQRQFADQIGCRLGCGAVGPARLLAVLVRIIGLAERNPNARRRDQEAHREAVAILLSVFLLAVATPFAGPPLAVARAVGVFGFLTCLTVQRGVDEEEEEAVAGLLFQQFCRKIELISSFRHRGRARKRLIWARCRVSQRTAPAARKQDILPACSRNVTTMRMTKSLALSLSPSPAVHLLRPGSESATMTMVRLPPWLVIFE